MRKGPGMEMLRREAGRSSRRTRAGILFRSVAQRSRTSRTLYQVVNIEKLLAEVGSNGGLPEQQLPWLKPKHVAPFLAPQTPSVDDWPWCVGLKVLEARAEGRVAAKAPRTRGSMLNVAVRVK